MQKPKHVDFTADPAATTELLAQWEEHVEHDFPDHVDTLMVTGAPGIGKTEFIRNTFLHKNIDRDVYTCVLHFLFCALGVPHGTDACCVSDYVQRYRDRRFQ